MKEAAHNAIDALNAHPKYVAWLGTVTGWATVDLLRSAQIVAAILAAMVSVCALILTAPKAWAQVMQWIHARRS